MGKKYVSVPNDKRMELIRLIHEENMSIARAAEITEIYYPTAKAINKVFKSENRTIKKNVRHRIKKETPVVSMPKNLP